MALVKCGECGGQVSDKAAACPHCGAPVGSSLLGQKIEEAMEAKEGERSEHAAAYKDPSVWGPQPSPVLSSKRPPATDNAKKLREDETVGVDALFSQLVYW